MCLSSCRGQSQPDLETLSDQQWQEDLEFLVTRINKSFAGFTPETRAAFADEAAKLKGSIGGKAVPEKILGMAKLLAILHDGHTEVSLVGTSSRFRRYPITLYYFQDDLYVVATDESHRSVVGSVVKSIDGVPIADVLERLKPYMNRDNDIEYITTAPVLMTIPEILYALKIALQADSTTITITKDGHDQSLKLEAMSLQEYNTMKRVRAYESAPLYLQNPDKVNWYRYLPEHHILYISFKSLFDPDNEPSVKKLIKDAFIEFDKVGAERLVVDFRLCRGGNYHNVEPLIAEINKRATLQSDAHVVVINGRLTFSAASVATLMLKDEARAIIVGEVSRARPNWAENAESYLLPNSKLKFDCLEEIAIHAPRLGNSMTIPVDVEIPKTFVEYSNGKDEVMEYIFNLKY